MKRTPLKRTGGTLKKGAPLKSKGGLKRKAPDKQTIEERKAQSEKDWDFYRSIWANRPHACQVHDGYKFLGYEPKKYMFDHLLEKELYPHLRYEPDNIVLVCGDCHGCKTNGFPKPEHQRLIEQAKEKFL